MAVVKGKRVAFWTPENRFTTDESPAVVTLVTRARAVRARLSACPEGLEGCVAKRPFTLRFPASGSLSLTFPENARPVTLDVQRLPWHPLYGAFLALIGWALWLLFRSREERELLAATLLTGGLYFSQTLGQTRGLDVAGHLGHVQRIAEDGLFVNAQACWECFQPPLYYAFASGLLGFPATLGASAATLLQGFTLLLHCLSVPLVVAALRPYSGTRTELLLRSALVLLWPAAILASARLGNDGPVNLAAFGVMLLLLRERLVPAAAVAAAALLVKGSALPLVALVAAWGSLRPFRALRRVQAGIVLGLGCAAAGISNRLKGFDPGRFGALAPDLRVHNTWANVVLPDPLAFLREPFVSPWVAGGNREPLLNYFWKSSLFGEWAYEFPGADTLALALSWALLLLLAAALISWWRAGRPLFPALLLTLSLASVTAYRLLHPFASNPDFRFVYPLTALAVALALRRPRWPVTLFLAASQLLLIFHWWFEA